jgi:hypothetical protein
MIHYPKKQKKARYQSEPFLNSIEIDLGVVF